MPRHKAPIADRQYLLSQLENFRITRDNCREPQRSIFTALIQQIENELAQENHAHIQSPGKPASAIAEASMD